MVIQGRPNVNLLPPAGGRVAQTALQLRDQGIRVRGQNIQAELARLQADLRREQLTQQQRQFDVNTMIRRETLAVESQFREQEIALREETLGITRQRLQAAENRFEQSFDLQTQRFTEGQRQFGIEQADRQLGREREAEGIARKSANDLLDFLRAQGGPFTFNPETKQLEVKPGAENILQQASDLLREAGQDVSLADLLESMRPDIAAINRERNQQDVGRAAQLALTQAQTQNLLASAEQKRGLDGGISRQAVKRTQDIERQVQRLSNTSRKIQLEIESNDEKLLEKQAQLPEKGEAPPQLVNEIAALQSQRLQRVNELRDINRDAFDLSRERRQALAGPIPEGVEPFEPVQEELGRRAQVGGAFALVQNLIETAPLNQEVDFWDTAIEALDEDLRMRERAMADDKPDAWERVKVQLNRQRSVFVRNRNEVAKTRDRADRERVSRISGLGLSRAIGEQVSLTAQIEDIRNEIEGDLTAINEGGLDIESQNIIESQITIRRKFLNRATQLRMQLANQIDTQEEGGNILSMKRNIIAAIPDASDPAAERVINEATRVIDDDLAVIFGEVGEGFRGAFGLGEGRGEKIRRGKPRLRSLRDGSFLSDLERRTKAGEFRPVFRGVVAKFREFATRKGTPSLIAWSGIRSEISPRLVPKFDETFRITRARVPTIFGKVILLDVTRNQEDFLAEIRRDILEDLQNGTHRPEDMPAVAAGLIAAGVPLSTVISTLNRFDHFNLINAPIGIEEVVK